MPANVLLVDDDPDVLQAAAMALHDSGLALREEVFLPFFTTKQGGHRVGLSLARQTVLAHGGAIRVEQCPHLAGACLRLVL